MGDAGDNDGFERRLAGQAQEPTANTQELHLAAHAGERTNADLILGDVSVTGARSTMEVASPGAGLLPWVIVAVLVLVLLVVVFGFLGPAREQAETVAIELAETQLQIAEQRHHVETLEVEAAELRQANESLVAEGERRAAELEMKQRAEEEQAARDSRPAPAPKPKPTTRKRKRTRRR